MKNIFILGASSTHGVGAVKGGWAARIQQSLHQEMYEPNGPGEICNVYELAVPGTSLDDLIARLTPELQMRTKRNEPEQTCIIFTAGMNDSKAMDQPENYLYTIDEFAATLHSFIHLAKDFSTYLIGFGLTPVDEAKTSPHLDPVAGRSYFRNQRIQEFEQTAESICADEGISFVPLFQNVPADWQQTYLFRDGIHPNDRGHEWIYNQAQPVLRNLIGPLA